MSQETSRYVPATPQLAAVRNFRDVGGMPTADGRTVRFGRLYRSGHLAHATAEDTVFLNGLRLRTVFDFRSDSDIAFEGRDVELTGVRHVHMPLFEPADAKEFWRTVRKGDVTMLRAALGEGRAVQRMKDSYREMVLERTREHSRLLHALSDDELPALVHCAAGKDRAGLSVVVVLLALGVRPEAIEADYLASNAPGGRYLVRREANGGTEAEEEAGLLLSPLFDARAEYLHAALATIEETWGGTERYLTEGLGVDAERRERLCHLLLDGPA